MGRPVRGGTGRRAAVARRTVMGLLAFGAVSAAGGAVLGTVFGGAGVPLAYLAGTPFDSYLVPGLILGIVVGGTQTAALVGLLRRSTWALGASAIAGFGLIIWIFVEMAVIGEYSFLQAIYFGCGVSEILAVTVLLGIAPRLVDGTNSPGDDAGSRRESDERAHARTDERMTR